MGQNAASSETGAAAFLALCLSRSSVLSEALRTCHERSKRVSSFPSHRPCAFAQIRRLEATYLPRVARQSVGRDLSAGFFGSPGVAGTPSSFERRGLHTQGRVKARKWTAKMDSSFGSSGVR